MEKGPMPMKKKMAMAPGKKMPMMKTPAKKAKGKKKAPY